MVGILPSLPLPPEGNTSIQIFLRLLKILVECRRLEVLSLSFISQNYLTILNFVDFHFFFAEKCRKYPIRILPYVNCLLMVLHPWCLGDLMLMPQVTECYNSQWMCQRKVTTVTQKHYRKRGKKYRGEPLENLARYDKDFTKQEVPTWVQIQNSKEWTCKYP